MGIDKKEAFLSKLSESTIILWTFVNEYGERYEMYKYPKQDFVMIAGDETDWTPYIVDPQGRVAHNDFLFNELEIKQVKKGLRIAKEITDNNE